MQGGHEVHGVGVTGEREKFNSLGEFPRGWAGVGCRRLTPQVNADEGMGNVSGSQSRFRELCPPGVFLASALISFRVPCWLSGKESACQRRRLEFDPRVGKIPWGRKWQPRLVSLPGEWTQEPGGIVHGVARVGHDFATKPPPPYNFNQTQGAVQGGEQGSGGAIHAAVMELLSCLPFPQAWTSPYHSPQLLHNRVKAVSRRPVTWPGAHTYSNSSPISKPVRPCRMVCGNEGGSPHGFSADKEAQ